MNQSIIFPPVILENVFDLSTHTSSHKILCEATVITVSGWISKCNQQSPDIITTLGSTLRPLPGWLGCNNLCWNWITCPKYQRRVIPMSISSCLTWRIMLIFEKRTLWINISSGILHVNLATKFQTVKILSTSKAKSNDKIHRYPSVDCVYQQLQTSVSLQPAFFSGLIPQFL